MTDTQKYNSLLDCKRAILSFVRDWLTFWERPTILKSTVARTISASIVLIGLYSEFPALRKGA